MKGFQLSVSDSVVTSVIVHLTFDLST